LQTSFRASSEFSIKVNTPGSGRGRPSFFPRDQGGTRLLIRECEANEGVAQGLTVPLVLTDFPVWVDAWGSVIFPAKWTFHPDLDFFPDGALPGPSFALNFSYPLFLQTRSNMKSQTIIRSLPLARILFAIGAIGAISATGGMGIAHADMYEENLAKWKASAPAHYRYKQTQSCFCPLTYYQVEAEGGRVIKETSSPGTVETPPGQLQRHSIDSLFALIKKSQDGNVDRLHVTYDARFGIPVEVHVDPIAQAVDEEYTIRITEFAVLPFPDSASSDSIKSPGSGDPLTENWAKWKSLRPERYEFRTSSTCECRMSAFQVEAEREKVVKAVSRFVAVDTSRGLQRFSIDTSFSMLAHAKAQNPYRLNVVYDPEFGFPQVYEIDRIQSAIDDERFEVVEGFKVLVPLGISRFGETGSREKRLGRNIGLNGERVPGFYHLDNGSVYKANGAQPKR
jgi:hypothetical protein